MELTLAPSEMQPFWLNFVVLLLAVSWVPGLLSAEFLIKRLARRSERIELSTPTVVKLDTKARRRRKLPQRRGPIAGELGYHRTLSCEPNWKDPPVWMVLLLGVVFTIVITIVVVAGVLLLALADERIANAIALVLAFVLLIVFGILGVVAFIGVAGFFLLVLCIPPLLLVRYIRPSVAQRRIEASDEAIQVKLPFRRLRTIPWRSISRIDVLTWGEGPWDGTVAIRIYWDTHCITLYGLEQLAPEVLQKLRSIPGVDASYAFACWYELEGTDWLFAWLVGKSFTAYSQERWSLTPPGEP